MGIERGLFSLHIAVFLFGLAGLFGKLVHEPALVIVAGRTGFAWVTLFAVSRLRGKSLGTQGSANHLVLALTGLLLAVHWLAFFQAIQVSTVAVGLLTFASFPLFVTFLEPLFFKEKPRGLDYILALLVTLGLVLVVPRFDLDNQVTQGAAWGVLSGLTFAILSLLNRKYVSRVGPWVVAFHQNLYAALALLPFLVGLDHLPSPRELMLLAFLGIICTALAHGLFINALKTVRASLAGVTTSLEPVYGIVLAAVLLGEVPTTRALIGGAIILMTTFLATLLRNR